MVPLNFSRTEAFLKSKYDELVFSMRYDMMRIKARLEKKVENQKERISFMIEKKSETTSENTLETNTLAVVPPENIPNTTASSSSPQETTESDPAKESRLALLKEGLADIEKKAKSAKGVALFIAIVNTLWGMALILIPSLSVDYVFPLGNALPLLLIGWVFFGVAIGIGRKSRAAILFGLLFMIFDTALSLVETGVATLNSGYIIMRCIILVSLVLGAIAAFRYHKLKKVYGQAEESEIATLFQQPKCSIKAPGIVCIVFIAISIGTAVYGIGDYLGDSLVENGFLDGFIAAFSDGEELPDVADEAILNENVATWREYTMPSCGLSIRMPGEVESYAETSDDGRDVLLIAESGQDWVYASVLYYPDSSDPAGTVEEIQAYRQEVLDSFLTDMGEEVSSDSGMMGDIAFDEAVTYSEGILSAIRVFISNGDLYIASISTYGEPDDVGAQKMMADYFASMQVDENDITTIKTT